MAAAKDFNVNNVPKGVSDPKRLYLSAEFPKHLHKFDMGGVDDEGLPVTVPTRRFIVAHNGDDVARYVAEGWEPEPPAKPRSLPKPDASVPAKK